MIINGKDVIAKPGDKVKIRVKSHADLQLRNIIEVDNVFKMILITLFGKDVWVKAYQIVSYHES